MALLQCAVPGRVGAEELEVGRFAVLPELENDPRAATEVARAFGKVSGVERPQHRRDGPVPRPLECPRIAGSQAQPPGTLSKPAPNRTASRSTVVRSVGVIDDTSTNRQLRS